MKTVLIATILTMGIFAQAAELECSANISDSASGKTTNQTIELKDTQAGDFKAKTGEILSGDYKLGVYRNITNDVIHLYISKKNDSDITPYIIISNSSSYKSQAGQMMSLNTFVGSTNYQINCSLK